MQKRKGQNIDEHNTYSKYCSISLKTLKMTVSEIKKKYLFGAAISCLQPVCKTSLLNSWSAVKDLKMAIIIIHDW